MLGPAVGWFQQSGEEPMLRSNAHYGQLDRKRREARRYRWRERLEKLVPAFVRARLVRGNGKSEESVR
jgi:hypothetical protein